MDAKQAAAAMAAVELYLQQEAAAMAEAAIPGKAQPDEKAPSAPIRLWGLSGRQDQMQIRRMMQMKAFKNS